MAVTVLRSDLLHQPGATSGRIINGVLYIANGRNCVQAIREVRPDLQTSSRWACRNTSLRPPTATITASALSFPASSVSTTFTSTTAVDGSAWDLSSAVTALAQGLNLTASAGGSTGVITDVNDGTDTITVSSWAGGTPANGSQVEIALTNPNTIEMGTYYLFCRFYSHERGIWSNPSEIISVDIASNTTMILVESLPTSENYLDDDVSHVRVFRTQKNPRFEDLTPNQSNQPRGTFYFADEVELGTASLILTDTDRTISGRDQATGRDFATPRALGIEEWNGRAWYAGQDSWEVELTLTNGSTTATLASSPTAGRDVIYEGCVGDGILALRNTAEDSFPLLINSIVNMTAADTVILGSAWTGATDDYVVRVVGEGATVFSSEVDLTLGSTGIALPESVARYGFARSNFDFDDGYDITGIIAKREFLVATKETKWGYISGRGQNFKTVEEVGLKCLWDRNMTKDEHDRVYIPGVLGIHRITSATASEVTSDSVRNFFVPAPDTAATDYFNMSSFERCVLKYHPRLKWLVLIGPAGANTNNDLCLIFDLRTNRWYRFTFFGVTKSDGTAGNAVTSDITWAMTIFEAGQWEMYLVGKFVINGVTFIGRVFKLEEGNVDEASDGTDRRIDFEMDTYKISGGPNTIQLVEANIETVPQSTGSYTAQVIADLDSGNDQAITPTVAGDLTVRNNSLMLPCNEIRAGRIRLAGSRVASGIFHWQRMSVAAVTMGKAMR